MDVSIIISGNLTGFSRFYTSPGANELYNTAKFDFDYRNFLTFLNTGDKAYAISFSGDVVAVSLVTRILDSFNRPGVLVVTALVPRRQVVTGADRNALYNLLNQVNDRFYSQNFINGIIKQNPAVLMQDYYSDILANFKYSPDSRQKAVNANIDSAAPSKRVGYVAAAESDMPLYLASLMRKSYTGYHHVFFAEKAPQNISEPAEEVITYHVRIENNSQRVPGEVRLSDRIPVVSPGQGEQPLQRADFTYAEVLRGDAGSAISAVIDNETIVLSYRFPKEEKTITFKFYEGRDEVPAYLLRPVVKGTDGSRYPISSDSWTFIGPEIYNAKSIESGSSEYFIEDSRLDLARLRDGATVQIGVFRGWRWSFNPAVKDLKPLNITLKNTVTGKSMVISNVTSSVERVLQGNPTDWVMDIDSDYYEPIKGASAYSPDYSLKKKSLPDVGGTSTHPGNPGARVSQGGSSVTTQGGWQQTKTTAGGSDNVRQQAILKKEQQKKYISYGLYALAAVVILVAAYFGFGALFNRGEAKTDEPKDGEISGMVEPEVTPIEKEFALKIYDATNTEVQASISKLHISFDNAEADNFNYDAASRSCVLRYTPDKNRKQELTVNILFKPDTSIVLQKKSFKFDDIDKQIDIELSVSGSDLRLYDELSQKGSLNTNRYNEVRRQIQEIGNRNREYAYYLSNLLQNKQETASNPKQEPLQADVEVTDNTIRDGFDKLILVLSKDGKSLMCSGRALTPRTRAEENRAKVLIKVLGQLNAGNIPTSVPSGLSSEQGKVITALMTVYSRCDDSQKKMLIARLKDCKSLHEINDNIVNSEKFKKRIRKNK